MLFTAQDCHWMSHALSLARNGVGMTSPNPPVGAVLVSNGQAIGEGFHRKAGMPHAEREAFADALKRGNASLLPQSTLYVTLEPCSTSGRTPACTDAILEYGVKRVVYGTQDPNPKHAGAADKLLAIHGIVVEHGVMEEECRRLIRPFTKTIKTGMPWVVVKTAASLDGRIARMPGKSQWLTSEAARNYVHTLRSEADAILTGGETVRVDNPAFTIRTPDRAVSCEKEQPWRMIVTRDRKSLPLRACCFTDNFADRTVVFENIIDYQKLMKIIYQKYDASVLMVEAGGNLVRTLLQHQLVDEWIGFYAPMILGGHAMAVAGEEFLKEEAFLEETDCTMYGPDVCIRGLVRYRS